MHTSAKFKGRALRWQRVKCEVEYCAVAMTDVNQSPHHLKQVGSTCAIITSLFVWLSLFSLPRERNVVI